MSSKPPSATAQLKKFSVTMRMIANLSHARESLLHALSNINAVERFLYESLDIHPDDVPPPSTRPARSQAEAPTRFNPAWDAAAFEKYILGTYKDAASEAERANVRTLIEKGVDAKLLTAEQAKLLLAKLK